MSAVAGFPAADDVVFRTLTDAAPVMLWVALPDGTCTYLSRSWSTFTGQSPAEGLGGGWTQAIHPEDRSLVADAFAAAVSTPEHYQVEYRVRHASGEYRWMLDSAAPMLAPDGALRGYIGSLVDNHQRKQAELARERSERRLEIAAEASSIGIWSWDLVNNTFEFSPRALAIFGFAPDAMVSFGDLRGVILPEDLPEVLRLSAAALDPAIRGHEPYRYRIRRADDGAVRWVYAQGEAIFSTTEPVQATSYVGTFQDITEEIERERNLAEAASRLNLALDAAGLAVWELDIEQNCVSPSPRLNELYGFPPDARPTIEEFRSRYAPGEQERLERLGREAVARGESEVRAEVKHILPDGTVRWLLIQAQSAPPALNGGGPRAIGVVMDVTERRLNEERLAIIAGELQHRVKNSFAVVQTLVNQSFRPERTVADGKAVFSQRLQALLATTELLTQNYGTAADLRDVVDRATSVFRHDLDERFSILGADLRIPAKLAVALGMALHELGTNAVKYGALSNHVGKVALNWWADGPDLRMVWKETGGPAVSRPASAGFGTRLLSGALLTREQGEINLDFPADGVRCEIWLKHLDDEVLRSRPPEHDHATDPSHTGSAA